MRYSKDHELAECEQFISDEIQARWDIVKQNKLCHVCLKSGHMRGRCESRIFCSCGSDRRHHRLLHNPPRLRDAITAQDPHLDRQREIQAAQADIQYKDQGTQFPQNPRTMEQYATITEAPSRTILLHVVPVKVIAPSGSSLTTYALLQQEHCEQSGFKRTATACVREHCCRENELTFPVGALRVAVSYRDRRNCQSGRGASVRNVQYTRKVSS